MRSKYIQTIHRKLIIQYAKMITVKSPKKSFVHIGSCTKSEGEGFSIFQGQATKATGHLLFTLVACHAKPVGHLYIPSCFPVGKWCRKLHVRQHQEGAGGSPSY